MQPITIEAALIQHVTQVGRMETTLVFDDGLAMVVLPKRMADELVIGRAYRLTLTEAS